MSETSFNQLELDILEFWKKENIFSKTLEQKEGAPLFVFNDGPPFATGLPHYGHLLASTIKDTILRYKTMQGFYVPRRFGWDCHGLPVETEIEKLHNLKGSVEIEEFGIGKFNEECRSIVGRFTKEWEKTIERIGRWVDFSDNWHTMDTSFMESVWWAFKTLQEKDLVYEGFKVMPISPKLGTPLSNFEATSNYKQVDDPSITVRFFLEEDPKVCLLAWTTTPWTLPSNAALCVHKEITYVKVKEKETGITSIVAEDRVEAYFANKEHEIEDRIQGIDLVHTKYRPLFETFIDQKAQGAFQVISADFVSTEEGTGIVHTAPAHGEDDFYAAQAFHIPLLLCVDDNGQFTDKLPEYAGLFVKDADKKIIQELKQKDLVFEQKTINHRYPFCWRTDFPLIYKAVTTWFIAVEKIKDRIMENNNKIHWMPEHIKHGRFGKWLENARDWAISRFRYWGTPIPIWRSEDGTCLFIGSIEELEELSGEKITDLHRHFIDQIQIIKDGKTFTRIPDVFDCWFESGSMPFAQNHYPFEQKEAAVPADFIAEGLDQTRGWFYTLNVLATALFDQPAFKNVIVNGILLAEDGNKMSKRLKNYPEPGHVIEESGADSVRLYMLSSPAAHADDLRFSKKGVAVTLRHVLIPLTNALHFYTTYSRIYQFDPNEGKIDREIEIDRWILSVTQKLTLDVQTALDQYNLPKAVEPFAQFIDQLTNWYIRRSRSRFWADQDSQDRRSAFKTLYTVLKQVATVSAPFIPFLSEKIFQDLKVDTDPISVHLCDFPTVHTDLRDEKLEEQMSAVQAVVGLGHALRKEIKIKVRQPLQTAYVICSDPSVVEELQPYGELISQELNVKEVLFETEEKKFVTTKLAPNFRVVGKKVGSQMPALKKKLEDNAESFAVQFAQNGILTVDLDGTNVELTQEDIVIKREVKEGLSAKTDGRLTLALDTQITEDLAQEGMAREIVNKINTLRRDLQFDVQDRIDVVLSAGDVVQAAYDKHKAYIEKETLIQSIAFADNQGHECDLNGYQAHMMITQVKPQQNKG